MVPALDLSLPYQCVFPEQGTEGALGTLVREDRIKHLMRLQEERAWRNWKVRGVPSDHVPLAGSGALGAIPQHRFFLNESPLRIYHHLGGRRATFFELVAGEDARLDYIEVVVRTNLPSNAFLLARQPLNALLDLFAVAQAQPLVYQRLDLVSPTDEQLVAHELILPFSTGLAFGPMGGIDQVEAFARYDAILREAMTASSPFYQFLCAYRLYEGTNSIRRWLKLLRRRFAVADPLPRDPVVDLEELRRMGFQPAMLTGIRTVGDLSGRLADTRDAIAHFLLKSKGGSSHVYLADGSAYMHYSICGAVLLRYARRVIDELKTYYERHFGDRLRRGMVLPVEEQRDQYIVRDPGEVPGP